MRAYVCVSVYENMCDYVCACASVLVPSCVCMSVCVYVNVNDCVIILFVVMLGPNIYARGPQLQTSPPRR
jgi:hypothetical protein